MRKKLFHTVSLIALLVFAAGCGDERENPGAEQQQQEVPENAIGFSGSWWNSDNDPASRATSVLDAANIAQMTVYAHYTGTEDFSAVSSTSQPDVMENQLVEQTGGSWTYSPTKYWPTAGQKLSFFGITYGPGKDNGVELVTSNGESTYKGYPSFRVTPPATPSTHKDIGVAYALNRTQTGNPVPLSFRHAMHKVNFAARYTTGTYVDNISWLGDGAYMQMTEIVFGNVRGSGTLNITPVSGYDNGNDFSWTDVTGSALASYTITATAGELVSTNLLREDQSSANFTISTTPAGALMLVPQQQAAPTVQLTASICDGCGNTVPYERAGALQQADWIAGESTTYSFALDIPDEVYCWGFNYTGQARIFRVPKDGIYKLEAWGGGGRTRNSATGGPGGYAAGEISLKKDQLLYIYVGPGPASYTSTFNGGAGAAGGATDIRLLNGAWNDAYSLNSRILVAGGGGAAAIDQTAYAHGGAGGGLTGYNGSVVYLYAGIGNGVGGKGGEQTKGGAGAKAGTYTTVAGSFGTGSPGVSDTNVDGGGGGYYGGSGGVREKNTPGSASGGGGSSFVSGMKGCVAINPTATNNPRTRDTDTANTTALNYTESVFGTSLTWSDGDEIEFASPSMVDGQGYQWNTGAKGSQTNMPNPSGGTMTGNSGNGYARITLLSTPTPPTP
jgi:hypothetical protein